MARRHESLVPLSHDHRIALSLAFRLQHPSPPGPATALTPPSTPASRAADVLDFFVAHLDGHFRAEEDVLFATVAAQPALGDTAAALLRDLIADHRAMERLRDDVARVAASQAASDGALEQALRAFAELLERHVRREERELFAIFPELVPEPDASAIAGDLRAILDARPALRCDLPGAS